MTIMDYFKEKPERAMIYLIKRGCGHVSEFETEEGKTIEESIEDYLCYAGLCVFCPARPYDDECEERLKKWLNLPADELGKWTCGEYANGAEPSKSSSDEIRPDWYKITPEIEAWDVINPILNRCDYTGECIGYLKDILKYVLRADQKNGLEDYKKAYTNLKQLIRVLEEGEKE